MPSPLPARPRQRPGRRRTATLAALALLTGLGGPGLTGCTGERPADPAAAAAALADALRSGDLGSLALDGATPAAATESLRNALGELASTPRTVTVTGVNRAGAEDPKATATLQWSWDVSDGGTDWSYTTTVPLALAEDKTWHVVWAPTVIEPKLTGTERLVVDRSQGRRGEILDGDDKVLVGLRDVYRVGIDKAKVPAAQAATSAAALAALVGIDGTAYAKTVAASGAQQFVVAITLRIDDPRIAGKTAAVQAIPGGAAIPDQAMLAPTSTFARALLGTTGPATAEIVARSGGRIGPNDTVGLSGLQLRYDRELSGTPGLKIRAVGKDAAGTATSRTLFTQEPVAGRPLRTTLDVAAQNAAEATLAGVPAAATLVAIRPSTGEVLAAANNPATAGQNLAMTGRAAPGSTFKVISSLALLRAGLTADSLIPCTETVTVDGRVFKNYSDYPAGRLGSIPLRQALAHSCNTAYISQHATITQDALADAAAALGVGVDFDAGYASFFGSVPRQATATEHAASLIGQGRVETSALAMATVVASVVKGAAVVPRLVDRSGMPSGAGAPGGGIPTASATATRPPLPSQPPTPATPLTTAEAEALRSMLATVVSEGSGRIVAPLGATGAKTGTAQYGTEDPPRVHAWMIASRADLAVAVYVEDGAGGAATAGPLMKAFLEAYPGTE